MKLEQIIKEKITDKDQFIRDAEIMSISKLMTKYKLCCNSISKIIKEWNIERNSNLIKNKSISKAHRKDKDLSKEAIYKYYIEEDHQYMETIKHFDIGQNLFLKLLKEYNIKKDRSRSYAKGLEKRIDKYGLSNTNNWKKGQETRIENSGSLHESYKIGREKQIKTMIDKYGYECSFALDNSNNARKRRDSYPNRCFKSKLETFNLEFEEEFVLASKIYDFKIGKTLIEINPTSTHNINYNPWNIDKGAVDKKYHYDKSKLAENNGYRCIHVFDWDDKNKIIYMLAKKESIGARKCDIHEISKTESDKFINTYHIQGSSRDKVRIGLFHENKLVSVMTFGKPRFSKKAQWELIRYCSSINVTGGAQKLFDYFIDKYSPESILSYCDRSKFTGDVYIKLGFKLDSKGYPVCHFYNEKTKEHYLESSLIRQGFSRLVKGVDAKDDIDYGTNDNVELMLMHGFVQIYDCGQARYIWKNNL